ncbi:hypothetical protein [Polaromonas sp. A23]|uniref:hypothetical protein n=1 Tax=Polaromonas sp. A23 TaxID=1944133 RepID=UPI0011158388|nr:hypothetical protein [Polaromonas sp. A23]
MPSPSGSAACTPAKQLKPTQIHGLWRVRFQPAPQGLPADARMLIERHAEFSDSVAGHVSRDLGPATGNAASRAGHASRAQLAGDLEEGFLTLDESSNGVSITGTWNGEMVEGSCGKKVVGTWKDVSSSAPANAPDIPFTMEKVSGW